MGALRLKPTYKVVKSCYTELGDLMQLGIFTEGIKTVEIVGGLPGLGIGE